MSELFEAASARTSGYESAAGNLGSARGVRAREREGRRRTGMLDVVIRDRRDVHHAVDCERKRQLELLVRERRERCERTKVGSQPVRRRRDADLVAVPTERREVPTVRDCARESLQHRKDARGGARKADAHVRLQATVSSEPFEPRQCPAQVPSRVRSPHRLSGSSQRRRTPGCGGREGRKVSARRGKGAPARLGLARGSAVYRGDGKRCRG